jgi:type IV pilus assembly protein PilV
MVSLVILAMGLLGLLALHTDAQQSALETYYRTQALAIVDDMVNRLYANPTEAKSCYITSAFAKLPGEWDATAQEHLGCSQASDRDLTDWNDLLRGAGELLTNDSGAASVGALIGGRGCIRADTLDGTLLHVSVAWQGLRDLPQESDPCGAGRYDDESRRRVVSALVRLSDWK